MKINLAKVGLISLFVIVLLLFFVFDIYNYIGLDRIQELSLTIRQLGPLAPVVYILVYWLSCLFFLPGTPISLLGAVIFGPIYGSALISIGSTSGATLSFLFARYMGREFIEKKFTTHPIYEKIDKGLKEEGVRMLVLTRVVPIFPFNLQNYLYGLTDIPLVTFILVSWLCMLPGTIAYAFLAGAIVEGDGNVKKTFLYLAIGGVFLVAVSLLPKLLKQKGSES